MPDTYYVSEHTVTGKRGSLQTILYANMLDADSTTGAYIPATFSAVPKVSMHSPRGDRTGNIIENSITVTQFQVQLSDVKGTGTLASVKFNFTIRGSV